MKPARLLPLLLLPALLRPEAAPAQVISDWSRPDTSSVISSAGDGRGREVFMDWTSTLGEFEKEAGTSEADISEAADSVRVSGDGTGAVRTRTVVFQGKEYRLPSIPDGSGTDLYLLTDEGAAICLAFRKPPFYQDTDPDVMKWIRYYGRARRSRTEAAFGRFSRLREEFEEIFRARGVPPEMTLLCIIESACTDRAVSRAGAAGTWQLMPSTARELGMRVDSTADWRFDPLLSAHAAARYLRSAYERTGSWAVTAAAYNCGIARAETIIREERKKDWDRIKHRFPKETRQYVPALIAVYYVWTYRKELGFGVNPRQDRM